MEPYLILSSFFYCCMRLMMHGFRIEALMFLSSITLIFLISENKTQTQQNSSLILVLLFICGELISSQTNYHHNSPISEDEIRNFDKQKTFFTNLFWTLLTFITKFAFLIDSWPKSAHPRVNSLASNKSRKKKKSFLAQYMICTFVQFSFTIFFWNSPTYTEQVVSFTVGVLFLDYWAFLGKKTMRVLKETRFSDTEFLIIGQMICFLFSKMISLLFSSDFPKEHPDSDLVKASIWFFLCVVVILFFFIHKIINFAHQKLKIDKITFQVLWLLLWTIPMLLSFEICFKFLKNDSQFSFWIWLIKFFLFGGRKPNLHLLIILFWIASLLVIVIVMMLTTNHQKKQKSSNSSTTDQENEKTLPSPQFATPDCSEKEGELLYFCNGKLVIKKIVVRKFFHFMAVMMFLPIILIDVEFLGLCFAIAFALFCFLESFRLEFRSILKIAQIFDTFMRKFTDSRDASLSDDSYTLIVTHIYLLIGCAIPVWITQDNSVQENSVHSVPTQFFDNFFYPSIGVLVLGIGDNMASIIGSNFGKLKWPNSKKTVEGTLGCFFSCVLSCVLMYYFFSQNYVGKLETGKNESFFAPRKLGKLMSTTFAILMTTATVSLLESFTIHIDNLILPFYGAAIARFSKF